MPSDAATRSLVPRMLFVLGCAIVLFVVLFLRLIDLSFSEPPGWLDPREQEKIVRRGDVIDTNGVVLASSIPAFSMYADPRLVRDIDETARTLSNKTGIPSEAITARLTQKRGFVWLKRQMTLAEREEIEALELRGIGFRMEYRRVYPYGALVSHVVGVTDIDGNGLSGIEFSQNSRLSAGEVVQLSLDVRFQTAIQEELAQSIEYFSALGGAAVVLDLRNGDIKALVSNPDYAPRESDVDPNRKFNRATLGVYELGSTMKLLTAAMAIEEGRPLTQRTDISQPIRMGRFALDDYERIRGSVSLAGMIRYSSNIAAAKIALDLGAEKQRAWLDALGVTKRLDVGLPEAGTPLVPSEWRPINVATISYGHGLATTPLNLVTAIGSVAGSGERLIPSILKGRGGHGERLFSESTVETMRKLMRVVVTSGTGRKAERPGYQLGGKTGTADKVAGRGYDENRRISSFVGAFPMNDPRYAIYLMVDEPKGRRETYGFATGGWVAAPAVGRVVSRITAIEGMLPVSDQDILDVSEIIALDNH